MKILWLCDEEGWAYSNNSQTLARAMPKHEHRFMYYKVERKADLEWPDIIVCSHPEVIKWMPQYAHKMVLRFATRMFRLTPTVLWFCDERGWAYDQRARLLTKHLPDYNHHFAYYFDYKNDEDRRKIMSQFDIVVCMFAAYAKIWPKDNTVVTMSGFRSLPLIFPGRKDAANDKRIEHRECPKLELGDSFRPPET